MPHLIDDLIHFIQDSPTAWHAVKSVGDRLASVDFTPLEEESPWTLKKGEQYFAERSGSICAFSLPKTKPTSLKILGAHTDSPALKIKPNPTLQSDGFCRLATEIYGGPLLSSWMNRDLAIAGRIICQNSGGSIKERLVFLDEVPLIIPQIAIHLDREVNEKGLLIDKQNHLNPILSLNPSDSLESVLKQSVNFTKLLAFDLFLVPLETPRFLGRQGELLASYRLDNLVSAHAATTAMASAKQSSAIQIMFLWDAEEVGSHSAEGAASSFASDILKRIQCFYGWNEDEWLALKASSLCISADVAHAYNPNYAKKFDPNHQPLPGKGVVIRYNANKKYVTDAKTAAAIVSACHDLKLPYQSYTSRSDMGSGSTIGPIFATQMGLPTVDIGVPLLSMHSIREVMAVEDHLSLCKLLTHLLER